MERLEEVCGQTEGPEIPPEMEQNGGNQRPPHGPLNFPNSSNDPVFLMRKVRFREALLPK